MSTQLCILSFPDDYFRGAFQLRENRLLNSSFKPGPSTALLYIKAGLKSIGNVFLMTDAQVAEERFLVLINDLLASGEIPELLADDEIENVINNVRGEVSD